MSVLPGLVTMGTGASAATDEEPTRVTTTMLASGSFTVPAGITTIHVKATGGAGGMDTSARLEYVGRGGVVESDMTVTPGTVVNVTVGGNGGNASTAAVLPAGGTNGGGSAAHWRSGGGGGASDVRIGGTALSDRKLMAAGGGGAAYSSAGTLPGGDANGAGSVVPCSGAVAAAAGQINAGGAGSTNGTCSARVAGAAGALGVGGTTSAVTEVETGGAGGGAGWYGGGSGGSEASGAGGVSAVSGPAIVTPTVTISTAERGAIPAVEISYARISQDLAFMPAVPTERVAGSSVTVSLFTTTGSTARPTLRIAGGTTNSACSVDDRTLNLDHAGQCSFEAVRPGEAQYLTRVIAASVTVRKAATTTILSSTETGLRASVSVEEASTLSPTGVVEFRRGDTLLDTIAVVDGVADLAHAVPADKAGEFSATFVATADLTASFGTMARQSQAVAFTLPPTGVVGSSTLSDATGSDTGLPVTVAVAPASTEVCAIAEGVLSFQRAGTCSVTASQAGDWTHLPAASTAAVTVDKTETTTDVSVLPTAITAQVSAPEGSAHVPTGEVRFTVDGRSVGMASLNNGVAELAYVVPVGAERSVSATYLGNRDALTSQVSVQRLDPTITATVPAAPASGWFRTPVTISYTCVEAGSPVVCPQTRTVSANGRTVARDTVRAEDGGAATAATAVRIDALPPTVKVTGVGKGVVAGKKRPTLHCVATDAHSGVASCVLRERIVKKKAGRITISYTATALDRAGNRAVRSGTYVWKKKK